VTQPSARAGHRRIWMGAATGIVLIIVALVAAVLPRSTPSPNSTQPISHIGLYDRSASYASVAPFTAATGVKPDVLTYYSSWLEPFRTSFAQAAAQHGAVTLVEINPDNISLGAIAGGQYDGYLRSYAQAVRAYRRRVILSFGHEMNGHWYTWGFTHASPPAFVAAWRHVVDVFRGLGVRNVTWLWTVNIINMAGGAPPPARWWPGGSYVTWVGIDGYYYRPSWTFTSLFGPTIAAVRALTRDPILISETGAPQGPDQPSKIADLFAGIRLYQLLGFVWFDAKADKDWRLSSPAAFAAVRQGAGSQHRTGS